MSGIEATQALKRDPATASIPVLLCTASRRADAAVAQAGADEALRKPFSLSSLYEILRRHVGP